VLTLTSVASLMVVLDMLAAPTVARTRDLLLKRHFRSGSAVPDMARRADWLYRQRLHVA